MKWSIDLRRHFDVARARQEARAVPSSRLGVASPPCHYSTALILFLVVALLAVRLPDRFRRLQRLLGRWEGSAVQRHLAAGDLVWDGAGLCMRVSASVGRGRRASVAQQRAQALRAAEALAFRPHIMYDSGADLAAHTASMLVAQRRLGSGDGPHVLADA